MVCDNGQRIVYVSCDLFSEKSYWKKRMNDVINNDYN